jgi:hypothetical protein
MTGRSTTAPGQELPSGHVRAESVHPAANLPCRNAIRRKYQQHALPDIGINGGARPQSRQWFPFDVGHVLWITLRTEQNIPHHGMALCEVAEGAI